MQFRTEISPLENLRGLIDHNSGILLLGSCFADSVGDLLRRDLFNVTVNPFGPLYNPLSIDRIVDRIVNGEDFTAADLFSDGHLFRSYLCHTLLTSTDPELMVSNLNDRLRMCRLTLASANPVIIITLGSAWVYRLKETGEVVANCHKQPARLFSHSMISLSEAIESLSHTVAMLRSASPNCKLIFTVSPIRHTAYGLHGNQLSKATLLLAENEICCSPDFGDCIYFPSYEAVIDDLRDYRFYASDMKHPSDVAVDYIYDLFTRSFFTDATIETARAARSLTRRLDHRMTGNDPEAQKKFINDTRQAADNLLQSHPELADALTKYNHLHV